MEDFEKIRKAFENLSGSIDGFLDDCARETAARFLSSVIKKTPVGKAPKGSNETVRVTGENGKTRRFLTADAARMQQYWSGYTGGTLRRAWTAKTESEAENGGGGKDAEEYAGSLGVARSGNERKVYVTNPMKYASYVEHGHFQEPGRFVPALGKRLKKSFTEPKHFTARASVEVQRALPAVLDKKIEEYISEVFRG